MRAAVFAAVCVLPAAVGHVLMSGTAVPWQGVVTAFAVTAAVAAALAGRERGLLSVTAAAVTVQAGLHAAFSFSQAAVHPSATGAGSLARRWVSALICGCPGESGTAPSAPAVAVSHAGHHAGHGSTPHLAQGATPPSGAADSASIMGPLGADPGPQGMAAGWDMGEMSPSGMLAAHLLAAVLCGLWLGHGERAAHRIARAVAGWLAVPLRPMPCPVVPAPGPRPLRPRRGDRVRRPRLLLLAHAITSRGPPPGTAVL
ncbi:hypothetical protein [Streptomyces sp. CAU 1734]|uniref:hypothetical protein n=1 Tax=Streptomyces sp. CAU 1734 TaxID=3140360 RepID=UPI00326060C0